MMKRSQQWLMAPLIVFLTASLWSSASANEESWAKFDIVKARAVLWEFAIPDRVGEEVMFEWEKLVLRAERARADETVISRLREQQAEWRRMSVEMESELAAVLEQAERDAKVRIAVKFLRGVSFVANMVKEWQERMDCDKDNTSREGNVRLRQEQYLETFDDGRWKIIDMKKSWLQGNVPTEINDPAVSAMSGRLKKWAHETPVLLCNSNYGGCFEAPHGFGARPTTALESEIEIGAPKEASPYGVEIMRLAAGLAFDVDNIPAGYKIVSDN